MKLAYDDWRKNKEKNYPFAGYTVEIDSLSNAPLTNGGTYTINLGTETRLYNEPYWVITSRTIHYVKYGLTGSDSVASPDVIQEGHSNVTSSKNNPVVNNFNLEKDGHHYVSYETVQRSYNVAFGIPDGMTDNKGNMNSIIIFDGQINPTITDWVTPDPDVTQTKSPGKNLSNKIPTNGESYNYLYRKFYHHNYYDKDGNFHQKTYLPNNEGEPITITYYHNQPVDLSFEDISKIDPQDLSGSNYSATNELTTKNDDSNQYNVYDASNGTKSLSQVISDIEAKGYKLVSITNDDDDSQTDLKGNSSIDLIYNKDGVWKSATGGDNADNLIHKRYTIKFVHDVKPTTKNTSVSRNIHYVADEGNSKYEVLKNPDTQTVNFERTAYIDQVTKQEVIKNADGTYSELPADFKPTWKAVGTDNFDKIQKDRFNKDEGKVPGVWEIERANYDDPEGTQLTDNFAPKVANVDAAKTYNDIYLVYKQKAQYNIHYIDVNGVEDKNTYTPTDGYELTDHLVPNVGEGKGIFIGDTPDATQKLWSPADYEKAGYVLVGLSDNAKGDLLGKQTLTKDVQDQYVYLKHAITPSTDKTPKEDVKAETVSQVRTISYRDAETGEKITDELKKYGITANVPDITQTIDYVRVPLYDAFKGMFLGFAAIQTDAKGFAKLDSNGKPEIKKDTNGQPIIATRDDKASWVPTGEHTDYPEQGSPDLTKYGYVKESSLEQKTNNKDGAQVDAKDGDPTQSGGHVDVYYFHEQEDITYVNPKFNIDQKDLEKTFKRTIIYRGTKDGHTYEDVNGSPDGTHKYVQTTTFTRKAIVDAVTKKVIKYTPWTSTKTTLVEVISKTPTEVGYDNVDIKSVSARTVDPDKDPEDLGTTVVTYTVNPTPTPEPNPGNGGNTSDGGNTPDGGSEQPNNPGNNNEVPGNPGGDNETPKETPTPKDDKTTPEKPDEHDDLKFKSPDEHNHTPKKEVNKTSNNTPRSERWNSNKSPKSENVNNVTGSNSAVKSTNSPETVKENTLPQTG
ncbi:MucBP domain protein [Lactobacillus acidophilus ATCC 4796]|uniref:mucin-binding protein n=1 Tax=Lactobacillus acidophilus TaxID=1579 RepID=UPI00019F5FA2|nr:hypothetical protein [Lactobacillus acidophilus]EEJ75357.1 MucBP domain protein [Lactobacillus acidophilus ATCC 4796]